MPTSRAIREVDVPGLPAPVSHYAHATIAGGLLFVSGLLPLDADNQLVGEGDAAVQAQAIFAAMKRILDAVAADFTAVAKLTIFLTDIGDRQAINRVRQDVFGPCKPASTLVEVSRLVDPRARVEIEAVVALQG
jgi:2-iminobutanoate/2-iminopropanoate deaminase